MSLAPEPSASCTGSCTCGHVRYRVAGRPLIVHCCHCTWCQRETGSAFALNAVIEASAVTLLDGDVAIVDTPSQSGNGQKIARCPRCRVAVWSNYPQAGPAFRFIRVGTLDQRANFAPDIHIYTSTKQPWVAIPDGAKAFAEFYDPRTEWPAESLRRFAAARAASAAPA